MRLGHSIDWQKERCGAESCVGLGWGGVGHYPAEAPPAAGDARAWVGLTAPGGDAYGCGCGEKAVPIGHGWCKAAQKTFTTSLNVLYQLGEGGSLTFSVTVATAPNWACRRVGVNTQLPGSVGVYHATCLLNGVGRGTEPVVHRTAVSRPVSDKDKGLVTSDKSTQHALVGAGSRFLP